MRCWTCFWLALVAVLLMLGSVAWGQPAGVVILGTQDAVRYAAPSGSDTQDGRSWATAKRTVLAAYDALPAEGGTIHVADLTHIGQQPTDGLWLLGPNATNYATPPAGWRQAKWLRLVGVGTQSALPFSPPRARLLGGSGNDPDPRQAKPAIWVTGLDARGIDLERVEIASHATLPIRVGCATDLSDRDGPVTTNVRVRNVGVVVSSLYATNGPGIEVCGQVFFGWLEQLVIVANPTAPLDSDPRAAILVRGGTRFSSWDLHVRDVLAVYGGLRYYASPTTTWNFTARTVKLESDFVRPAPPAVWVLGGTGHGTVLIEDVEVYDAPGTTATVIVDPPAQARAVVCTNCGTVIGPATLLGASRPPAGDTTARHGQVRPGESGPVTRLDTLGTNLLPIDPVTWGTVPADDDSGVAATVTTPVRDPDGQPRAGRLELPAGNGGRRLYRSDAYPFRAGDCVVAGVWARRVRGAVGPVANLVAHDHVTGAGLFSATPGLVATALHALGVEAGDHWQWTGAARRIDRTTVGTLRLSLRVEDGGATDYVQPHLLVLSVAEVGEQECYRLGRWARPGPGQALSIQQTFADPHVLPQVAASRAADVVCPDTAGRVRSLVAPALVPSLLRVTNRDPHGCVVHLPLTVPEGTRTVVTVVAPGGPVWVARTPTEPTAYLVPWRSALELILLGGRWVRL